MDENTIATSNFEYKTVNLLPGTTQYYQDIFYSKFSFPSLFPRPSSLTVLLIFVARAVLTNSISYLQTTQPLKRLTNSSTFYTPSPTPSHSRQLLLTYDGAASADYRASRGFVLELYLLFSSLLKKRGGRMSRVMLYGKRSLNIHGELNPSCDPPCNLSCNPLC